MATNNTELATKADLINVLDNLENKIDGKLIKLDAKIDSVKNELNAKIDGVADSFQRFSVLVIQKFEQQDIKFDALSNKMDKFYSDLMGAFERTAIKGEKYDQKADTHKEILMEHGDTLLNHETCLTVLEK